MNSALSFHLRKPFAQVSGTFCGDAELFQPVLTARNNGQTPPPKRPAPDSAVLPRAFHRSDHAEV
jgi:hypothetical protein